MTLHALHCVEIRLVCVYSNMSSNGNSVSDGNSEPITNPISSRTSITLNVMKKDVGMTLIKALFAMELKLELSIVSRLQKAFCKWKLTTSLLFQQDNLR